MEQAGEGGHDETGGGGSGGMGGGGCSLSMMSPALGNHGSLTSGMLILELIELEVTDDVDRALVVCRAFLMSLMAAAAVTALV